MPKPIAVGAILFLSACNGPDTAAPTNRVQPDPGTETPPSGLFPLSSGDLAVARLNGELACTFTAQGSTLLFARGDVASTRVGEAVARTGSGLVRLEQPGGFDGMLQRARFTGDGQSVQIDVTGAAISGGEAPPRVATLTFQPDRPSPWRADGEWTCGP